MNSAVYISGFGLASNMGVNLATAMQNWHTPPAAQPRLIQGLADPLPYFAISYTAPTWFERSADLLRQVVAEAGYPHQQGALYIASTSLNIGAIEAGEPLSNYPAILAEIAGLLGWQGSVHWINTACTSSLNALMAAQAALQAEVIDDALIIGFELENQLSLAGFAAMQLLSLNHLRPFAADRDGLVLGEAITAIHLSRTPSRWRLAGGAHQIDSRQASGASVSTYEAMLSKTLIQADWTASAIDLIKVQAAGSPSNDAVEAQAINAFFATQKPALISLKPYLGHTLGAAGAAEIALLLKMLCEQKWPPASTTDAQLHIEFAPIAPPSIKHILICILGFGGSHCCVAIEDTSI